MEIAPAGTPFSFRSMVAAACTPNIGPRQRRRRLIVGIGAIVASVVTLAALLATDTPRAARFLAALPFWAGALGFLQFRERT